MKRLLILATIWRIMIPIQAQNGACKTEKKEMFSGEFGTLFEQGYNTYLPDETTLQKIDLEDVRITVVLGLWCEDSQREVPRFLKMAEHAAMRKVNTEYHVVNREKFCPEPAIQELKAPYVPTFIFYKNGREMGRIIEHPEKTLEEDMLRILGSADR